MTSHSLNLANDVVNLTRQKNEMDSKIEEAREIFMDHLTELALAAGMEVGVNEDGYGDLDFHWPNP